MPPSQILASGRADHPWFGMATADLPQQGSNRTGMFVQAVTAGAARLVLTSKVGSTVRVEYQRSEQQATSTLTLAEQP
ncbi:hypothetical protein BA895_18700 [Humibacillus sp. DSM 29435]|uniref:hypothetical protein n=1 Tax=Humibacillus sp. DSM 29435 TaxID=1869167 RepID=UPI000872A3DD|nr:hypothetical protein [Humibacillus sp. DSM 29435]OFE16991.1 hypothetical protein BA895_18700 [Humibacillus sp. DSM 29435]